MSLEHGAFRRYTRSLSGLIAPTHICCLAPDLTQRARALGSHPVCGVWMARLYPCYLVATTTWPTTVPILKARARANPLLSESPGPGLGRLEGGMQSAAKFGKEACKVPPSSERRHVKCSQVRKGGM